MIVCLCEGVSDRQIRHAIERGADSVGAVAGQTRAGTGCGACRCSLRDLLHEARRRPSSTAAAVGEASLSLVAAPRAA